MKPEDKVCTLEQAKWLVELRVVLETEKYWFSQDGFCSFELMPEIILNQNVEESPIHSVYYPAPDVAELGKVLEKYYAGAHYYHATEDRITGLWSLPDSKSSDILREFFKVGAEAEARCAVLIWLIENDHIKPEEIKL